jgi:hypothetical protein
MQFREQGQVIQIIRTTQEAGSKKGKKQVIGRLVRVNPQVSEALNATLTVEERKELAAWLKDYARVARLKKELAVRTLSEQLGLAADWFANQKSDDARALASSILLAWHHLRVALKRDGLVE